jgi:hypothetical protein
MTPSAPSSGYDRRIDALVVGVAIALFARSVGFGFTDWDDLDFIVRNPLVADPMAMGWQALLTTPWLGYPQTIPVLTWHLDTLVGGGDPWAFHATNVLLHGVVTWLVLTVARSFGLGRIGSAAAAILFATHPLVVEPVCWATGRKDLLAAVGLVGAFAIHRRAMRDERDQRVREVFGITACTGLGLLSKPLLLVLPLLFGADYLLHRRRPERLQRVSIAITATLGLGVTALSMAQQSSAGALRALSFGDRLLYATQHASLQIEHTIMPLNLVPRYLDSIPAPLGSFDALRALALCAALVGIGALAWARGSKAGAMGVVWWCISFAPVSGLVPLHRGPADVYSYVPLIGLALAAGAVVQSIPSRRASVSFVAAFTLTCAGLSWSQSARWERPVTLWAPMVDHWPDDHRAWWALADAWRAEGQVTQAVAVYEAGFDRLGWPDEANLPLSLAAACHSAGDRACTQRWLESIGSRYPMSVTIALRYVGFVDHDLGGPGRHGARFDRELYQAAEQYAREALVRRSAAVNDIDAFASDVFASDPLWIPGAQRFATELPTRPAAAALLDRAGIPVPPIPQHGP